MRLIRVTFNIQTRFAPNPSKIAVMDSRCLSPTYAVACTGPFILAFSLFKSATFSFFSVQHLAKTMDEQDVQAFFEALKTLNSAPDDRQLNAAVAGAIAENADRCMNNAIPEGITVKPRTIMLLKHMHDSCSVAADPEQPQPKHEAAFSTCFATALRFASVMTADNVP